MMFETAGEIIGAYRKVISSFYFKDMHSGNPQLGFPELNNIKNFNLFCCIIAYIIYNKNDPKTELNLIFKKENICIFVHKHFVRNPGHRRYNVDFVVSINNLAILNDALNFNISKKICFEDYLELYQQFKSWAENIEKQYLQKK